MLYQYFGLEINYDVLQSVNNQSFLCQPSESAVEWSRCGFSELASKM
jgi:hypothetical protein